MLRNLIDTDQKLIEL
ncbi:hypothetical protein S7711_11633 [Stachybotrys chartarum IBT 7711]|uniref:Uncharacterized protein n=1 Tax=Stachybotrys chartarum (strain CBS 109288 / IBT 7711) TaxID=1280523 RepID=A0A084B2W2_STACB|nr:hypothetical protein S7711_11633 [Stachybotrys chartarum IBT 7711]